MNELSNIAKTVKATQRKAPIVDLVFNPLTGDFEETPHGVVPAVGQVVTEFIKYGYA